MRVEHIKENSRTFIDNYNTLTGTISVGTRAGDYNTSPRLSAIYSFDKNKLLKMIYGKTFRYSDDSFDPEETQTYEVNYLIY